MKTILRHIGYFRASVVALLLLAGSAMAQAPLPPPDELDRLERELEIKLEESVRQAADEYLEAIQQFENLLNDYSGYFSRIDDATLRAYDISFDQFAKGLERGTYSENPRYLAEDIDEFVEHLDEQEARLESQSDGDNRKLVRLLRNLRRDLVVIRDLLTEDIAEKIERHKDLSEQIQEYVQKILRLEQIRIANLEDARAEYQEALKKAADELREANEDLGRTFVVPSTPTPPKPPEFYVAPKDRATGEIRLVRTYTSNMNTGSRQTPIYVSQPYGSVSVVGWKNNQISAELKVEVAAGSHESEKTFITSTTLQLSEERNGYYVEAVYPRLNDPQTRILQSELVINVPSNNTVNCDNAFGTVTIKEVNSGASIKGNYSTLLLQDIGGNVRVENAYGPVAVKRVKGNVNLLNSFGKVEITDCQSTVEVENSGSTVVLSDNRGRVSIINSGPVEINNHRGPVEVENNNGMVRVIDVAGDVTVFGSGQAVLVEEVKGSAILENNNAAIVVVGVTGSLRIDNRNGNISAEEVGGPLDLVGQNGDIHVVLAGGLPGTSHIDSRSGNIVIAIPQDSDLLVSATTEGGEILSTYAMDLRSDDDLRSATIKLGTGQNRLTLKGSQSSIHIEQTE